MLAVSSGGFSELVDSAMEVVDVAASDRELNLSVISGVDEEELWLSESLGGERWIPAVLPVASGLDPWLEVGSRYDASVT